MAKRRRLCRLASADAADPRSSRRARRPDAPSPRRGRARLALAVRDPDRLLAAAYPRARVACTGRRSSRDRTRDAVAVARRPADPRGGPDACARRGEPARRWQLRTWTPVCSAARSAEPGTTTRDRDLATAAGPDINLPCTRARATARPRRAIASRINPRIKRRPIGSPHSRIARRCRPITRRSGHTTRRSGPTSLRPGLPRTLVALVVERAVALLLYCAVSFVVQRAIALVLQRAVAFVVQRRLPQQWWRRRRISRRRRSPPVAFRDLVVPVVESWCRHRDGSLTVRRARPER